jgi:hypothetical protein
MKQKSECSTFKSAQKLMEIPKAFTYNYFLKLIEDLSYGLGLINYEIKRKIEGYFNILHNYIASFLIKDIHLFSKK